VLPLLRDYYLVASNLTTSSRAPPSTARNNLQQCAVAQDIWDVLHDGLVFPTPAFFFQAALLMTYLTTEEMAELKSGAVQVMDILVNAGVPRARMGDKCFEGHAQEESGTDGADEDAQLSQTVRYSFESFCCSVAAKVRKIEGDKSLALRLPLLLSADEEAVIYDTLHSGPQAQGGGGGGGEKVKAKQSGNPTVPRLLVECLPILSTETTDETTLLQVLALVRGAMYLSNPQRAAVKVTAADSFLEHLDQYLDSELSSSRFSGMDLQKLQTRWDLCDGLYSMLRTQDGDRELLAWVQSKFDALGCTQVTLRLCSHESVAVQVCDMYHLKDSLKYIYEFSSII
jgi:hypothetical protein